MSGTGNWYPMSTLKFLELMKKSWANNGHRLVLGSRIEENPKTFLQYIKLQRIARKSIASLSEISVEPRNMNGILNTYFASMFIREEREC